MVNDGPGFWILDFRVLGANDHADSRLPPPLLLHALLGSGSWISVAQEGPRPAIFGKHSHNPRSKIRKTAQNLVEADYIWQESKIQNPRSGTRGQGPPPPHGLRRVNLEILDPGSWIFTMTKLGRCFHELRLIRPHEDPPGLPRASRAGPESKVEWGELCEDPQVPSQTGHSVALSRDRILSLATLKIHSLSHRPVRLESKIHHYWSLQPIRLRVNA